MSSYVSRLILAGCLMVPCLLFGQVTIECIVNQTVTAGECNDCTNITDSVFVKFGLRCINGSDTTILEGPVRIKARGSSGDVVMFDYRANPPQGSTQSFFFNVSAAAQFGDIQDVFAYVRDCASFLVDYGDSTNRVHWGDTLLIRYPEATIAPGDTTYYWIIMANGADPDTITMSEVVDFVQSGEVTITKNPTTIVFHVPDMRDSFNLYALPDSSNRLILARNGIPQDTVDFFGIGLFNDSYVDSAGVWNDDTVMVYRRDTSGIIDSFPIVIPASSINTDDQQVTNFNFNDGTRVLTLEIEDDGQPPHTVTIPDDAGTDDQQLSLVTDGLIDTIFLEDGGFVVLHDSVGVGQPDTYLDSVRHITDGLIDSIWFYRDSSGILVDSFLVVLHDSTGTNTNDTYLSATWCSGDTLFAQRSDTSGIIDTLIVAGIPCSRDTCELLVEQITFGSAFGYSLVTGLRYTYCGVADSVCFIGTIKYIPYQHDHDSLYFLTETIVDCDSVTIGLLSVYIKPSNDIRVDTTWFVDDTLYQQIVDTSGIIDTIITEILTKDFDFILLDGDTMVTLVDTLIPRDSADLHKLIWHGGRVRLGLPAYEHSIYLDTTSGDYLNFVLHQDSVDTGLQIFGRRSALDIYHHTRPYQHFRNQFGEFWQRIFDPTAEGPLEPQRWEFGAVGKYDNDTTSRAIFTIRNDADPFSLNITPNFLQSDIYKSDRVADGPPNKIFAADSSGRFVLVALDSIGDINILTDPDHDWYGDQTTTPPDSIMQRMYTMNTVVLNSDSAYCPGCELEIHPRPGGDVLSTIRMYTDTFENLFTQIDAVIRFSTPPTVEFEIVGDGGMNYRFFSQSPSFQVQLGAPEDAWIISETNLKASNYTNSRNDAEPPDSILTLIYPDQDGTFLTASIDSLAAALQLTGIISGSDSLGRDGTAGRVVLETATKAPQSSPNFTYDPSTSTHLMGYNILMGGDAGASDVRLEIGYNRSAGGNAYIDLHSTASSVTQDARIIRLNANGNLVISNEGTGKTILRQVGSGSIGLETNTTERVNISSAGAIQFNNYTSTASFPGTAVGLIGFDASGNLLTEALVAGGVWTVTDDTVHIDKTRIRASTVGFPAPTSFFNIEDKALWLDDGFSGQANYFFGDYEGWSASNGGAGYSASNNFHYWGNTGVIGNPLRVEFESNSSPMQFYIEGKGEAWYGWQDTSAHKWSYGYDTDVGGTKLLWSPTFGLGSHVAALSTTGIFSSNFVGVGTEAPGTGASYDTKLHVYGTGSSLTGRTALIVENATANSAAVIQLVNSAGNIANFQLSGPSYAIPSAATFSTIGADFQFNTNTDVASGGSNVIRFSPGGWNNTFMTLLPTHFAGFGITTPETTLDILGLSTFRNQNSTTSTSQIFAGWGTNPRFTGISNRNIIHAVSTTASSGVGLDIRSFRHLGAEGAETDWTSTSAIQMHIGTHIWRNGAFQTQTQIRMSDDGTHGVTNPTGNMTFWTSDAAGGIAERMRIDPDGEIGIGTTNPLATLHVQGSGLISSLSGTGTRMVTATSTGVLGTAAIPSGADGNGIYTGSGSVGGGASVTATVASGANFLMSHNSVNKLAIGTSGTFLRSTSGGSVLVGDPTNEMAFYYNSGSTETRMRANNAGTGSYVYVANDGNMGMRATGSGDNILFQASGNVQLTSSTADIIIQSGGGAGDATSISGFDYVNISANSTTGIIEMVPASGSHGALYVVGSAGNVHISNETTTGGSAEYITINPSQIAINTSGNTRIAASTGLVELFGNVAINNGSLFGTGAAGVIGINNASGIPSDSPVNMVQLYAQDVGGATSSELRVRDEGGTVTTLSPHNFSQIPTGKSEELAWSHYSEKDGKYINVDMLKLVRHVERITGDKLVYSADIGKEDETVLNYRGIIDQQAAQISVLTEQINKLYDLINKKK